MRRVVRFFSVLWVLCQASMALHAQAIDSIFVETYHVRPDEKGGAPLVTYRIWVDLAPGYRLQMIYGNDDHPMIIRTTTEFFNDLDHGVKYANDLNADILQSFPLALDSWLTIGSVSDRYLAVPLALDHDGSIFTCSPKGPGTASSASNALPFNDPLCLRDGLMAVDSVPQVVNFRLDAGYFGTGRGYILEYVDGAWAVLGGTPGVGEENLFLIAQVSTTGELSFKLNLQIGTPDHTVLRYVASDARENEIAFPGLIHGKPIP